MTVVSSVTQFTKNQKLLYQRNKENNKLEWFSYWVSHSGTRTKIVSTKINFQLIKFYPWSYWFHTIRQRFLNPSFIVGWLTTCKVHRHRNKILNVLSALAFSYKVRGGKIPYNGFAWAINLAGFQILDFRASGIVVKAPCQENPAHGQRGEFSTFSLSLCDK